jgi:hypothetical protein
LSKSCSFKGRAEQVSIMLPVEEGILGAAGIHGCYRSF